MILFVFISLLSPLPGGRRGRRESWLAGIIIHSVTDGSAK